MNSAKKWMQNYTEFYDILTVFERGTVFENQKILNNFIWTLKKILEISL